MKNFPHKTFTGYRDFSKDLAIEAAKAERQGYRCVVEVIESKDVCVAGYKKGDKLVFTPLGMFLADESTSKIGCSWLFSGLVFNFAYNEALLGNNFPIEKIKPYFPDIECPDPGAPIGWGM